MHLAFEAKEVTYNEALDGDIIQVSFQEFPDPDIDYSNKKFTMPPPIKGVSISANYEFPPGNTGVEWCDGEEYNGGEEIREATLTNTSLKMVLKNGYRFDISFKTDDITLKNIRKFLLTNENTE